MNRSWRLVSLEDEEGVDSTGAEADPEEPAPAWLAGGSGTRIRAAVDGSPAFETFEQVYTAFRGYVWHALLAHLRSRDRAEDGHQRVFVTVARKIREHGGVPEDLVFMMHSIVRGEIRNQERVAARRRDDGEPDDDTTPASYPDPEQHLLQTEQDRERRAALGELLDRLTPEERRLLSLDHVQGLTMREIGVITGKRPGTVAVELHRARERLAKLAAATLKGFRRKA